MNKGKITMTKSDDPMMMHPVEYTIDEILKMTTQDLLNLFTEVGDYDRDGMQHVRRCRLLDKKCSLVCYGHTAEECTSNMKNHLNEHIKDYTRKYSRNPKFYSKVRFTAVFDGKDCTPPPSTATNVQKKTIEFSPRKVLLDSLRIKKMLNNPKSKDFSFNTTKMDHIFKIMSNDLLPSVVVNKIPDSPPTPKISPEKTDPHKDDKIHDAYDCRCENQGEKMCSSKRAFLAALGLEHISIPNYPEQTNFSRAWLMRTRLQKRKLVLEKIYRRHQSKVLHCVDGKRKRSFSNSQDVSAVVSTNIRNALRHKTSPSNIRQKSQRVRLIIPKQSSSPKANPNIVTRKPQNSKTLSASKQVPSRSHSTDAGLSEEEPYNPVGEVVRLPIEELQEILKEEWNNSQSSSSCSTMKTSKKLSPRKLLPPKQLTLPSQLFTPPDEDDPPDVKPDVCSLTSSIQKQKPSILSHRKPSILQRSARWKKPSSDPRRLPANKHLVQVKSEPVSDEELCKNVPFSISEIKEEPLSPSDTPRLCVSSLLFRSRRKTSRDKETQFGMADSSSTGTSSENESDNEDEEVNVTSVSDSDDDGKLQPPSSEKYFRSPSPKNGLKEKVAAKNTPEDSPMTQRFKEIKKEVEDIPVPVLTKQDLFLVGMYNDHTYAAKESECRDKMQDILSKLNKNIESEEVRTVLTRKEMEIREKALLLLRELRYQDKKKKEMISSGSMVPVGSKQEDLLCKICKRRFTATNSLYYHYRSHAGVKPYKCDICYKTFTRLHSLNYHMMIHDNTTRFKCRYCNRGFRHPSHYKEHLNKHTGEEPFQCQECGRRFKTSNTYRRHMLIKHDLKASQKRAKRILPQGLRAKRFTGAPPIPPPLPLRRPHSKPPKDATRSILSHSPPLPESPPPPQLPLRPFAFPQAKPITMVLFPKNSVYRLTYNDI